MIPLRDENPTSSRAWMTILLIAANVAVSIVQWTLPRESDLALVLSAGFIPGRLTGALDLPGLPAPLTLITSQFLHGGALHLAGNMLFLWIFGNNVEDELGSWRFLGFYLLSGIAAGLFHFLTDVASAVPTVGASGAISGVLGAYAILFPRARIHTLVILIVYITILPLPAFLWVGIWFGYQILRGIASHGAGSGVAWFAHVGGLLGGVFLIFLFRPRKPRPRFHPFSGSYSR